MQIKLDAQLRKLRKERGNTQEDLAAHLGLTTQAVSKWERGEGYPDIVLLPAIASFYDVSVDDLLGVGEIEKEKKLEEYFELEHRLNHEGKTEERIALGRSMQKEFPNNLKVLCQLMYALATEDPKKHAEEIIEYGKRILNESTENKLRGSAIQLLCHSYHRIGDDESAKKYAEMASNYSITVNELMPHLLQGEEAVEYCQQNIMSLFDMVIGQTSVIMHKGNYSLEDRIKASQFAVDCLNLLYSDGNFGFFHCRLALFYQNMAIRYLKLDDQKNMLSCLEQAAEHAIRYDTLEDGMYTAFMVNKVKLKVSDSLKGHTETMSEMLLQRIQEGDFGSPDDDRLQKVAGQLHKVATA